MNPQQFDNQMNNLQPQPSQDDKFKKLIVIAIVLGVLGVVLFAASLIFGGDDTKDVVGKSLAYHQEELRLVNIVEGFDSDNVEVEKFIANAKTLVASDQASFIGLSGGGVDDKVLLSVTDGQAQSRLEEANKINDLNSEVKETLTKTIEDHLKVLRTLRNTSNEELREVTLTAISNREQLLGQLEDL